MLCECGCGEEVKPGNMFINGHNRKGVTNSPEHCAAVSKATKGVPHTSPAELAADEAKRCVPRSPETCAKISRSLTGVPLSPEHRSIISDTKTCVPLSPEHCVALSNAKTGISLSSEHCDAISKAKRGVLHTSPAQIAADEAKRGGQDIVGHHYIYDESDLSLNTVQMTRSDHAKLHHLLRRVGYIVPHINII